jgi:cation:H+ antiporter
MPDIWGTIALFVVGLYILVKGAQVLVDGAKSIARFFGLSDWFIGIAIVGIGTSLPEFSVAVVSSFSGSAVGLSTVFGNNVFNALIILGLASLYLPILFKRAWLHDLWISLAAAVLTAAALALPLLGDPSVIGLTRAEGAVLAALFVVWLVYAYNRAESQEEEEGKAVFSVFTSFAFVAAGVVGVFVGGAWVVNGAEVMADTLGISSSIIGLLIVGVGTALSDFIVSIIAIVRKHPALAIGNVVGTNLVHFLGIPGFVALAHPIVIAQSLQFDIIAPIAASALVIAFVLIGRPRSLDRTEGALFLLAYLVYFIFFAVRG